VFCFKFWTMFPLKLSPNFKFHHFFPELPIHVCRLDHYLDMVQLL
jgi:hypothetical protein